MFIHDIIKIQYINEGYLPNYPYHMITDREMFDAFMLADEGYFAINYPLVDPSLQAAYDELIEGIRMKISLYLASGEEIPSWVYTYMLGTATSVNSAGYDIMYLHELMNIDVTGVDAFDAVTQEECYRISKEWLSKLPVKYGSRPATIFGEPHVYKSLRLSAVNVLDPGGV